MEKERGTPETKGKKGGKRNEEGEREGETAKLKRHRNDTAS